MDWFRGGRPSKLVRADIFDAIEKSLKRLQTDYIDLYQLHFPERRVPWGSNPNRVGNWPAERDADETPIAETLGVLDELVKAGKIRHFGVSNESSWGVMRFVAEADRGVGPRLASLQNAYNLVNRSFEVNLAEVCDREEVSLLAYSPLAQGYLTGKYDNGARPAGARSTLFNRGQRYETPNAAEVIAEYSEARAQFRHGAGAVCRSLRGEPALRHVEHHRRDRELATRHSARRRRCDLDRRDAEGGRRRPSAGRQSLSLTILLMDRPIAPWPCPPNALSTAVWRTLSGEVTC